MEDEAEIDENSEKARSYNDEALQNSMPRNEIDRILRESKRESSCLRYIP